VTDQVGGRSRPEGYGLEDASSYDGLDALSRPLAERVLRRAIELHDDDIHGPERVSRTTLEEIASELGVAPEYVRRALAEELETNHDSPSAMWERILAPVRVTGGRVVALAPQETRSSIVAWMGGQEGLRPRTRVADGVRWEKDRHWTTKLRIGIGRSAATGALRNIPSVTHRQTEISEHEQLVELDADTKIISQVAAGVGGGIAGAGLIGGIVTAAAMGGGSDITQFLIPFAPAAAVGLGTALLIAKSWLAAVRNGIDRALDGIANPSLHTGTRRLRRSSERGTGLARVLQDVADTLDDLLR
jgi:AraC-like DNA-binding protein